MRSLVREIVAGVLDGDERAVATAEPDEKPADAPSEGIAVGADHGGLPLKEKFDGAGIGSAMVANKVPGVRAALCYDLSTARNSREHNHANVLSLGAGLIGPSLAWQIVQEWLVTPWGGGRHERRVEKITEIDRLYRSQQ